MANAVRQILAAAANALEDEIDDFQEVVTQTRRSFRPNSAPRGRKSLTFFKRKTLLLRRANCDYCPIKVERDVLTSHGLGYTEKMPTFDMSWTKDDIENYLCEIYPKVSLSLIGFRLGKLDKKKKIVVVNYQNMTVLKENLGQSQIIIIPNCDIPLMLDTTSLQINERIVESNADPSSTLTRRDYLTSFRTNTRNLDEPNISNTITVNENDDNESSHRELVLPTLGEDAETNFVTISRENCVHDMLKQYKNETITEKKLSVTFESELGIDGGGLTKELFSVFFKQIECSYFHGEDCLIPYLPLNRIRKEKDNFVQIGRIIEHMLLLTGTIPSKISKITLMLIADPTRDIDKECLIQEFLNFVNLCERSILKKAINNFSLLNTKEKDIITNIFSCHRFFELPSKNDILDQVLSIASNTLIEAPRQFINIMRKGINIDKYNNFWEQCDFETLLDIQKVTTSKVANCLMSDADLTNEQANIFHHLEMYIRSMSEEKIGQFVFLVTGSYQMPDCIFIEFNNLAGLEQRPIFSTCTNTIHLPSTYSSYQEMKQDMDTCLNTEEAYKYTNY